MTERLYYNDSSLFEFDAKSAGVVQCEGRTALVLDRTAFYPTSGGQIFDTGWIEANGCRYVVSEVAEEENGSILHYIEPIVKVEGVARPAELESGAAVRGTINARRRRDHVQQHSGQHILSAAFEKLFAMPTVSFHMGDDSCTIDLATDSFSAQAKGGLERGTLTGITDEQVRAAEREANRIVMDDRPVEILSASVEQARAMGVRKVPGHVEGELRLIDIKDYDLNACGGTHVVRTGQVGSILLRKYEKVKQGFRVEFVCGDRALATARRDFETLTAAAALYATHIWEVPELVRKSLDEAKAASKERKKLLEEIAELLAEDMLAGVPERDGFKVITRVFDDRDVAFIKLLAQKITAAGPAVVLFGATSGQPGIVFAQTPGLPNDMGALMKEALATLGGRGGGNRDLAQGGAGEPREIGAVIEALAARLR
jgi:alanyl-tRNA synthetase